MTLVRYLVVVMLHILEVTPVGAMELVFDTVKELSLVPFERQYIVGSLRDDLPSNLRLTSQGVYGDDAAR